MINPLTLYSVALFLHIVGALGLFVALGLEWASLLSLRRAANAEQARESLKLSTPLGRLYGFSWLAILIPGLYMAGTAWRGVAWTIIALAAVVVLAVLGAVLTGRRMAPIGKSLASVSGSLPPTLRQQMDDPLLWASLRVRTAIALGIVFLMSIKPDLVGSLIAMTVAVVIGLVFSLPARGSNREKVQVK